MEWIQSRHWFRQWIGIEKVKIIWDNGEEDLWKHMVSLDRTIEQLPFHDRICQMCFKYIS